MSNTNTETAFLVLSTSALETACGGLFDSPPPPAPPPATVSPTLTCPAGTSPEWTRITGNLSGQVGPGVSASGSGTYETFSCKPVPAQPATR
jgi:hypothetical protein